MLLTDIDWKFWKWFVLTLRMFGHDHLIYRYALQGVQFQKEISWIKWEIQETRRVTRMLLRWRKCACRRIKSPWPGILSRTQIADRHVWVLESMRLYTPTPFSPSQEHPSYLLVWSLESPALSRRFPFQNGPHRVLITSETLIALIEASPLNQGWLSASMLAMWTPQYRCYAGMLGVSCLSVFEGDVGWKASDPSGSHASTRLSSGHGTASLESIQAPPSWYRQVCIYSAAPCMAPLSSFSLTSPLTATSCRCACVDYKPHCPMHVGIQIRAIP